MDKARNFNHTQIYCIFAADVLRVVLRMCAFLHVLLQVWYACCDTAACKRFWKSR